MEERQLERRRGWSEWRGWWGRRRGWEEDDLSITSCLSGRHSLNDPIQGESKYCPGLYRAPERKGGVYMDGLMDKNISATYIP